MDFLQKISNWIKIIGHWPLFFGNNKRAFTIAEMLLVTIILGLLMGIGGRAYYNERDRIVYNSALTKILGIIKTARDSAISSRGVPYQGKNIVPPDGFGVYININPDENEPHLTLFASLGVGEDGSASILNTSFDKGAPVSPDIKDYVYETYRLPDKMHFQFFKFNNGSGFEEKWEGSPATTTATEAVIFFRPPLAEMYIGGGVPGAYENLEELEMRFYNPAELDTSPKRCQYISINRIKTFPFIEYDNCTSSLYPLEF